MRDGCCDVRFKVDNNRSDDDQKGSKYEPVKGARAQFEAGYATLDQADNSPYASKERRGLTRDANYPTRY